MKKTKLLLLVALGILGGFQAQAAHSYDLYSAGEVNIDGFGYYSTANKSGVREAWGYGVGGSYFFTDNLAVGADSYMDAFTIPYLLEVTGIFRYPIKNSPVAAYGYGGFGRQWSNVPRWFGNVGGGVEYRFRPNLGAFADIRGVFPSSTDVSAVLRFGFRFNFK